MENKTNYYPPTAIDSAKHFADIFCTSFLIENLKANVATKVIDRSVFIVNSFHCKFISLKLNFMGMY